MKKYLKFVTLALLLVLPAISFAQHTGLKTNLLYWTTASLNIGIEQSLSHHWTADANVGYHPWLFNPGNISLRHRLGRVGVRYFPCRVFTEWFFGIHGLAGDYNLHNLPVINKPKEYDLQGWFWGAGVSAGYQRHLSGRWDLQLELDVSFVEAKYKKVECEGCQFTLEKGRRNYIGPTKVAISLVYMLD